MNLFVNYYLDQSAERQKELDDCIVRNYPLMDKMIIIVHPYDVMHLCDILPGEGILVVKNQRPLFNDFFKLTEWFPEDINIISNLDVVFDSTLEKVKGYYRERGWKVCMALSRWDSEEQLTKNAHGSQDVWIFCGAVPFIPGADFTMGVAGCDNKIAYLIEQNGYRVINPSKTIKCLHVHTSDVRNYNVHEDRKKILPPFKIIHPVTL